MKNKGTLVIIKPDAVKRGLMGEILSRFEKKGFIFKGMSLQVLPSDCVMEHYDHLSSKAFLFKEVCDFMMSGPSLLVEVGSEECTRDELIKEVRKIVGATNPKDAVPGSIRSDYGLSIGRNLIHASDSIESADRELNIWKEYLN